MISADKEEIKQDQILLNNNTNYKRSKTMRNKRKYISHKSRGERSDSNESLRSEISNSSKKIRKKKQALCPNHNFINGGTNETT